MTIIETKTWIQQHRQAAARHNAVADYLEAAERGASAEELQEMWHAGFEAYGPMFAHHVLAA